MNAQKTALLLSGSPRGPKSTSEALGGYLLDRLGEKGLQVEKARIHPAMRSDKRREEMLAAVDRADLLILAFPLYVDSLPAPVIRALEAIAGHRRATESPKRAQLTAIVNCGFPEVIHNYTALSICRQFAKETGIEWAGGLAMGMGGMLDGKPPQEMGMFTGNLCKALDLSAAALAEGRTIPDEAVELMARPLIPSWLYRWIGNMSWKGIAKKYGSQNRLDDHPHR